MSAAPGLRDLVPGQRVQHHKFGAGVVVATDHEQGRERAHIDFGNAGVRTLVVELARLTQADAPSTERALTPWEALVEAADPLMPLGFEPWRAWLGPDVLGDRAQLDAWGEEIKASLRTYPVAAMAGAADCGDWPVVETLLYPHTPTSLRAPIAGVVVLLAMAGRRQVVRLPFYSDWSRSHVVSPRRIRVCEGRVEALVEAELRIGGDTLPLAFCMPTFAVGRAFLARDCRVAVTLTALAYECGLAPREPLRVVHEPALLDAMRQAGIDLGAAADGATRYEVAGMAAWIGQAPRDDLVYFRGEIVEVQGIELPPWQRPAWRLRVRAWRATAGDWLVDVVFAASVWDSTDAPAVGCDVHGMAWLVGECLGPAMAHEGEEGR